jgi:hypothetical protein
MAVQLADKAMDCYALAPYPPPPQQGTTSDLLRTYYDLGGTGIRKNWYMVNFNSHGFFNVEVELTPTAAQRRMSLHKKIEQNNNKKTTTTNNKNNFSTILEYPTITYYWTVPLILDHSYLDGKLTSSKIADTKVSGF